MSWKIIEKKNLKISFYLDWTKGRKRLAIDCSGSWRSKENDLSQTRWNVILWKCKGPPWKAISTRGWILWYKTSSFLSGWKTWWKSLKIGCRQLTQIILKLYKKHRLIEDLQISHNYMYEMQSATIQSKGYFIIKSCFGIFFYFFKRYQ